MKLFKKFKKPTYNQVIDFIAKILTIAVFAIAIFLASKESINFINNLNNKDKTTIFDKINVEYVEPNPTNPILDADKNVLISKLSTCNCSLVNNGDIVAENFNNESIDFSGSLTLTDQELGLLYNLIFSEDDSVYLYEVDLKLATSGYQIDTLAVIHLKELSASSSKDLLPEKVNIKNSCEIQELRAGHPIIVYQPSLYNDLSDGSSNLVTDAFKDISNFEINKHVPKLLLNFINNFASKTHCDFTVTDGKINFVKKS